MGLNKRSYNKAQVNKYWNAFKTTPLKPYRREWEPILKKPKDEYEKKIMSFLDKWDRRWSFYFTADECKDPVAMFVYGTLRTGNPRAIAEIYGTLHDAGVAVAVYVGLPEAGVIVGELLYCEKAYMLSTLDRYEGYPTSYTRQLVTTLDEGVECWVYVAGAWRMDRLCQANMMESPACWRPDRYLKEIETYYDNSHTNQDST